MKAKSPHQLKTPEVQYTVCIQHRWIVGMKSWSAFASEDLRWLRASSPKRDKDEGIVKKCLLKRWVIKSINSMRREERLQGYNTLCAKQGTHNTLSVSWKCSLTWKDNRGRDLAIKGTSCQCLPLSCPLVPFTKSLS